MSLATKAVHNLEKYFVLKTNRGIIVKSYGSLLHKVSLSPPAQWVGSAVCFPSLYASNLNTALYTSLKFVKASSLFKSMSHPGDFAPIDHREQGENFCKTLPVLSNALTSPDSGFEEGLSVEKNKLRALRFTMSQILHMKQVVAS